jgi:hypothetical protein
LLDHLVAGEDIRPQTSPELAALITPEASKSVQQRLSKLWPGGRLTLVRRTALPDQAGLSASMFRLTKGTEALLISFALNSNGKISILGFSADRDYE